MDSLEYIDNYYNGTKTPEETRLFEQKIINDPGFAEDVAFYLKSIETAKESAQDDQLTRFREIYKREIVPVQPARLVGMRRVLAIAAVVAAVVLGIFLLYRPKSGTAVADSYLAQAYQEMSVTMGAGQDSLQQGLKWYQEGKYDLAQKQFQSLISADSSRYEAQKYFGLTLLQMKDYDRAISFFNQMAARSFASNPALYFEALALMKRNQPGDPIQAKLLLETVDKQQLSHSEQAREILNKW